MENKANIIYNFGQLNLVNNHINVNSANKENVPKASSKTRKNVADQKLVAKRNQEQGSDRLGTLEKKVCLVFSFF